MAIKFSQFNLRTDHTSGMYLVGYDGNQNIHITVDNLFNDFINGTENTIAMFGTDGTVLADSIVSQNAGATGLTVTGTMTVTSDATFSANIEVEGTADFNGNVNLGDESSDLITQTGTLYLNGPVKDTTDTLGAVDQVLLSDATGELTFTDLADLHVGGAEVVEVPVKNVQGSALVKGDPVYISGSVGASGRLEVQLADASNTLKMPAVGLLKQDLADNEEGFAVVTGKLRNLITDPIDGVTPTENDVIYVKPSGSSGAALTTTKPVYGNFIQNIGKVGRVSTSNDGNFVVSSILRTNDIPNLTPGRLWIGSNGNTIESQTLFVDEASGRLGIGTTTPDQDLTINGGTESFGLQVSESDRMTMGADADWNYIKGKNGNGFRFSTFSGGDVLTLTNAGNVGIGTTSPAKNLHIYDSSGGATLKIESNTANAYDSSKIELIGGNLSTGEIIFGDPVDSDVGKIIYRHDGNSLAFNVNASEKMRIDSSGQIQFNEYGSGAFTGTATKTLAVDVNGNIIETANPSVDGSGTANYVTKWLDTDTITDSVIYDDGTNVGIGTTSPADIFHVDGARSNFNGIKIGENGNSIQFSGSVDGRLSVGNSNWFIFSEGAQEFMRAGGAGRVGIGTTSPGSPLHLKVAGTGGSNILSLENDSNKYDFRLSGSDLLVRDGSNDRIALDSSGNVGIGTTSPGAKLDVDGEIRSDKTANGVSFLSTGGGASFTAFDVYTATNGGLLRLYDENGQTVNIDGRSTGGNTYFNNGGSVGIGTATPGSLLHVTGSSANAALQVDQTGTGVIANFKTSANSKVVITNSGNVGIGTTSPDTKLHISSTNAAITNPLSVSNKLRFTDDDPTQNNGQITGTIEWETKDSDSAGVQSYITTVSTNTGLGNLAFGTGAGGSASEQMRIDSSGNVGIGTAGPSFKLDVIGDGIRNIRSTAGWAGWFENTASSSGVLITAGVDSGDAPLLVRNQNASEIFSVRGNGTSYFQNGNVGIRTTSPSFALDIGSSINSNEVFRINGAFSNVLFSGAAAAPTGGVGIWNFINTGTTAVTRFYVEDANNADDRLTFRFTGNQGSNEILAGTSSGNVGIGTTSPASKLDVNGGIRMADDSSTASASNVGTLRYRTSGNNSYVDMCMQTGASTYAWVNIVQNNW